MQKWRRALEAAGVEFQEETETDGPGRQTEEASGEKAMNIEPEHLCIKCGLSDPEDEMVALYKQGEHDFLSAWAHPRCLGEYRMVAAHC